MRMGMISEIRFVKTFASLRIVEPFKLQTEETHKNSRLMSAHSRVSIHRVQFGKPLEKSKPKFILLRRITQQSEGVGNAS